MRKEIGEKAKVIWKEMEIPVVINDHRNMFGRDEYRVELLEDGEEVSGWVTDKWLEDYA